MDIRLYQRNYRDDLKQAIQQEQAASYIDAALSYKKAQHHATSANMLGKARFAMARRIHCLKMANDPQWKQVNSEFQQRYQAMEVY
jgi:predicted secreted Zn-dependent protease